MRLSAGTLLRQPPTQLPLAPNKRKGPPGQDRFGNVWEMLSTTAACFLGSRTASQAAVGFCHHALVTVGILGNEIWSDLEIHQALLPPNPSAPQQTANLGESICLQIHPPQQQGPDAQGKLCTALSMGKGDTEQPGEVFLPWGKGKAPPSLLTTADIQLGAG